MVFQPFQGFGMYSNGVQPIATALGGCARGVKELHALRSHNGGLQEIFMVTATLHFRALSQEGT